MWEHHLPETTHTGKRLARIGIYSDHEGPTVSGGAEISPWTDRTALNLFVTLSHCFASRAIVQLWTKCIFCWREVVNRCRPWIVNTKAGSPRIWSPLVLKGLVVGVTGTGLLPYIRPVYAEHRSSGLGEIRAYCPLRQVGFFKTMPANRFSIRRSDMWCHRLSQRPSQFFATEPSHERVYLRVGRFM